MLVDGARPTLLLEDVGRQRQRRWRRNGKKDTCWGSGSQFWDDALAGKNCRAWDWGGRFDAPSVFGLPNDGGDHEVFKNMPMCRNAECTMERFCLDHAGLAANRFGRRRLSESNATTPRSRRRADLRAACMSARLNILRIGGWTMCRNFEWMLCALKGRLAPNPTKVSRDIYFSIAPKDMDVEPLKKGTFYRCSALRGPTSTTSRCACSTRCAATERLLCDRGEASSIRRSRSQGGARSHSHVTLANVDLSAYSSRIGLVVRVVENLEAVVVVGQRLVSALLTVAPSPVCAAARRSTDCTSLASSSVASPPPPSSLRVRGGDLVGVVARSGGHHARRVILCAIVGGDLYLR